LTEINVLEEPIASFTTVQKVLVFPSIYLDNFLSCLVSFLTLTKCVACLSRILIPIYIAMSVLHSAHP
jgi:hypothetical protein